MRFRQTAFWRGDGGLGTTTSLDLERLLSPSRHLRWRSVGTVSEEARGLDWKSTLTLYQYLGRSRAFAYQAEIDGETDAPVTVEDVGLRIIYRQSVARPWLFGEIQGLVRWPRDEPSQSRRASFGIGIGFELLFGDHP